MEQIPHYFVAVALSSTTKTLLKEKCEYLREGVQFSRWVHPEDYHITLAFLGRSSIEKLEKASEQIKRNIEGFSPFPLVIDSIGIFGRETSPRIFWAGLKKEYKLQQLREQVFSACVDTGFELETRPFSPHITLARKWSSPSPFNKEMLSRFNVFEETPITFSADRVVLYKTNIENTPKYEAITSFSAIDE